MNIYALADNITGPLGTSTADNFSACLRGESAIQNITDKKYNGQPFYGAAIGPHIIGYLKINPPGQYTFLEKLFIHSISQMLKSLPHFDKQRTGLIISSTKGNIDLLSPSYNGPIARDRIMLQKMAKAIAGHFALPHGPVTISNACISGLSAIITAHRLINTGKYDHVIVAGGDLLSEFVLSGFQSFKAVSDKPCRPYDALRSGITLGEGCGTIFISNGNGFAVDESTIKVIAGAQTNDANHISGPSRTGEGLKLAIRKTMQKANLEPTDIDYINAHGTATIFNDEMESVAFHALHLSHVPVNSLKGYFGHTLGAAGIIESIITMQQMKHTQLLSSLGYNQHGVSQPLNVISHKKDNVKLHYALKTISGFGGCNAAVIFEHLWN